MLQVILDTNFLMVPSMFKVDVFKEMEKFHDHYGKIHIVTLSSCINELEKLIKKGNRHAAIGMKLAKRIKVINTNGQADKAIINIAKEMKKDNIDVAVATSDRKLIKTLNRNKIKIIRLRQKKYLTIEE